MKIAAVETLQADAGWRNACFVKITVDEGVIGWSEYGEHFGTSGVTGVIEALSELLIGKDPLLIEQHAGLLRGRTIQAQGGINQNAISALLNALLDIKGKVLGVPVSALLGGAVRDRLPVYWSHLGTFRVRHAAMLGVGSLRSFDDWAKLGEEARARGYKAVKTGLVAKNPDGFTNIGPGFAHTPGWPALNLDRSLLATLDDQLSALRTGLGPDIELMLDINFHFKTEGVLELARAVEPHGLAWLEVDTYNPAALSRIRSAVRFPIASLEALYGRIGLRPFLDAGAVDIAVIDLMWNGYLEATKMAALAEAYDVNVSTHNYCGGGLSDVISAHFAAATPNLRAVEYDPEDVPWKPEFLMGEVVVENGDMLLPKGPGWGIEVNEAFVRARPPR